MLPHGQRDEIHYFALPVTSGCYSVGQWQMRCSPDLSPSPNPRLASTPLKEGSGHRQLFSYYAMRFSFLDTCSPACLPTAAMTETTGHAMPFPEQVGEIIWQGGVPNNTLTPVYRILIDKGSHLETNDSMKSWS